MEEQDERIILPKQQPQFEEKNNLQGYNRHKLPVNSIFPAQKWMIDKKMLEAKTKKITFVQG